jgi:hypothetical protein
MNLRYFLEKLFKPIIYTSIFLFIVTIVEFFNFFKSTIFKYIDNILDMLSFNQIYSLGIWFNVILWIICGISFVLLSQINSNQSVLSSKNKLSLLIIGILICLVSFEKVFHIHLMFEFRAINLLGFFSADLRKDSPYYWVFLIVIPIFLLIFYSLFSSLYKLLKGVDSKSKTKKLALSYIIFALICIPLNILFDIIQGHLWYAGHKNTILNSIEAIFEVIGLICFIGFNKTVANYYFGINQMSK